MSEAQEEGSVATIGRSQGIVYVLPHCAESISEFLGPALERIQPDSADVQVLVVTPDAESALAIAEAAHAMNGATAIEVLPATSAARAARLLRDRPVRAVAGTPEELTALISGSHLKLDGLRTIVISWLEDVLDQGERASAALEALLSEAGKAADRVIVTRKADKRVEDFIERYARRPRRVAADDTAGPADLPELKYVTTAAIAKPAALRRLLDELNPPSAAVIVRSAVAESEARRVLRTLGYPEEGSVAVSRGAPARKVHTIVFYDPPVKRGELAGVTEAGAVNLLALTKPSDVAPLRELLGAKASALNSPTAAGKLRRRDDAVRSELRSILASGVPPREIAPLEPLLAEYDAVEIAAAALHLLERERRVVKSAPAAPVAPVATPAPDPRRDRERDDRPPFDRRGGGDRPRSSGPRPPRPGSDRGRPNGRSGARSAPPRRRPDR